MLTGVSSGIGKATALPQQNLEWTVYVSARCTERTESIAQKRIGFSRLNVTDEGSMSAFIERALEREGGSTDLSIKRPMVPMGPQKKSLSKRRESNVK